MLKAVNVSLRNSNCMYWMKVIFTFGLYLCFLSCGCCPRDSKRDQSKLVITNRGRVGVWRNVNEGSQTCCKQVCGSRSQTSVVTVEWHHVDDLVSTQVAYGRRRRWFGLCKPHVTTSLRVFFHKFPAYDAYTQESAASIPWSVSVGTSMSSRKVDYDALKLANGEFIWNTPNFFWVKALLWCIWEIIKIAINGTGELITLAHKAIR